MGVEGVAVLGLAVAELQLEVVGLRLVVVEVVGLGLVAELVVGLVGYYLRFR